MTGTALGQSKQPGWQNTEPSQDACSRAEGDAQAALSADRAPKRLMPKAAEQELPLRSAPRSTPLPEPAQEASATTIGLQDMMTLLMPPELQITGHIVPSQELTRPRNAQGAVRTGSAAAGAGQPSRLRIHHQGKAHLLAQQQANSCWVGL